MITPEQIEQDKKLCEEATPGPWKANEWYGAEDPYWCAVGPVHEPVTDDEDDGPDGELHERSKLDSAFISRARTAWPEYIAEVERLREENNKLLDKIEVEKTANSCLRAEMRLLNKQVIHKGEYQCK